VNSFTSHADLMSKPPPLILGIEGDQWNRKTAGALCDLEFAEQNPP
jgi:hypothetical protein